MLQSQSKILLIDDHQLFNDGLKGLLEKEKDFVVVGQVFDGSQALFAIHLHNPDLILLDINLPKVNGYELAQTILRDFPKLKIIMVTMYAEQQVFENFVRLGVHGYILKNATKEVLLSGIRNVLNGEKYFETEQKQVNRYAQDDFIKKFSLTPREIEMIRLIKVGLSSQEIADKIFLSLHTVKTHRRNIHFKLHTETTAELINFANEHGI